MYSVYFDVMSVTATGLVQAPNQHIYRSAVTYRQEQYLEEQLQIMTCITLINIYVGCRFIDIQG